MLFYLVVGEFKYLELVREGGLRGLRLCEIVNDFLVWERLLDVCVVEVDNGVSVWPRLSLHSVIEDHLLLSTRVHTLYFAVVSNYLIDDFGVSERLGVVLFRELQSEVLLFLFRRSSRGPAIHVAHILRVIGLDLLGLLLPETMAVVLLK